MIQLNGTNYLNYVLCAWIFVILNIHIGTEMYLNTVLANIDITQLCSLFNSMYTMGQNVVCKYFVAFSNFCHYHCNEKLVIQLILTSHHQPEEVNY